ncbi:MAG: hypothetical protein V7641_1875 [Blastocatellia bacterium]
MRKKATPQDNQYLSATQHDAIRLLISGCTARYTALVLKLNYANVRQWIKQDAQFQKEMAIQFKKQQAHSPDKTGQLQGKKIRADKSRGANREAGKNRGRLASG